MLENWRDRIPDGTPNYFLINIQPDDVPALKKFIRGQTMVEDIYPMVRGRLVAINDEPVNPDDYNTPRAKRLASREFNLSFADKMQSHNRLVAGQWWQDDSEGVFSVEEGIAETLGIRLGDTLRYSIAGREVSGRVSNLRQVEWDTFNVNFFVVSNPGLLKDYPATYITSFFLPGDKRLLLSEMVEQFPSVTVFDIDSLLTQVRVIMDQVVNTVEFVFLFTLAAGLLVMVAALQTTHDERHRESAHSSFSGSQSQTYPKWSGSRILCSGCDSGAAGCSGSDPDRSGHSHKSDEYRYQR